MNFNIQTTTTNPKFFTKEQKKRVVWFNPPFNSAVKTNIAKEFLKLVDKHLNTTTETH